MMIGHLPSVHFSGIIRSISEFGTFLILKLAEMEEKKKVISCYEQAISQVLKRVFTVKGEGACVRLSVVEDVLREIYNKNK